jgi:mRNA interferase RelE/StbE
VYKTLFHPRSIKFLKTIDKKTLTGLTAKLKELNTDPRSNKLDIKRLTNRQSYRMRYRDIRVIYEIDDAKKVIYVEDVGFRGEIY